MESTDLTQRLPEDMLVALLRRLPPHGLAAARCVCKVWHAVIDARRLLDLFPPSLAGFFGGSPLGSPQIPSPQPAGTTMSPPEPTSCHPTVLVELIVENILIRFPPDEPECLARASVVCKGWHRVLDDPGFRRRYSKFHHGKPPPMLGLVHNDFTGSGYDTRFAAVTSFSPRNPTHYDCYSFDSRHGLVLSAFAEFPRNEADMSPTLVVSDPITGVQWRVPFPRATGTNRLFDCWNAAVLCAADGCDHVDCHGNPFLVAFVGSSRGDASDDLKYACVYASEAGTWSRFVCCKHPYAMDSQRSGVLLGRNTLYFPCETGAGVMEYDVAEQKLSWFGAPQISPSEKNYHLVVTAAEDGGSNQQLGFVHEFAGDRHMCMWTMVYDANGAVTWAQPRVIQLDKLVPRDAVLDHVICFVEGSAGAILLDRDSQWHMADLNSRHVRKLVRVRMFRDDIAIPYRSFYTPRTSLERAEGLFQKGSDAMAAGDFGDAVRCLGRAHEIRAAFYGKLSPACAKTCYKYGFALLRKAQEGMGSNILKDGYSDLDLALKMLDNARAIVEKSPDHTVEKAKIFSALAAVSMERGHRRLTRLLFQSFSHLG